MPTFCRHGRFVERCPICTRQAPAGAGPSSRGARGTPSRAPGGRARPSRTRERGAREGSGPRGVTVRRLERAPDDGYEHPLVPGLRSSADASRLAGEIAFAAARLELMGADPPGLYATVTGSGDPEEALWLLLLVTYLGPLEGTGPFAAVEEARTSWASGSSPDADAVALGPRNAHEPGRGARSLEAYRAWAGAAGSQAAALAGEPGWSPQRRFTRAFERLSIEGLGRDARVELLVAADALGLLSASPEALALGARTPVVAAARRLFAIAEVPFLERRTRELADACGVTLAALDLALWNWGEPGRRATFGAEAAAVSADPSRGLAALGLGG